MRYADLAFRRQIPYRKEGLFTFAVPEDMELQRGNVVLAPLGTSMQEALVIRVHDELPRYTVKPVAAVVQEAAMLSEDQLLLAKKAADYFFFPLAKIFPFFVPKKLMQGARLEPEILMHWREQADVSVRGKKMQAIKALMEEKEVLALEQLRKQTGASKKTIESLETKGLLQRERQERKVHYDYEEKRQIESTEKSILSIQHLGAQQASLFQEFAQGRTLFLFPSAERAQAAWEEGKKSFGEAALLWTPECTDKQRSTLYLELQRASGKYVLFGTPTALFLPLKKLKTIVLWDEEHPGYLHHLTPRYDARVLATILREMMKAQLFFVSKAPSCFAIQHATQICLPEKQSGAKHITFFRQDEQRDLSPEVLQVLKTSKKAVIFWNKRGYYRAVCCKDCKHILKNPKNGITLVAHKKGDKIMLHCHHSKQSFRMPEHCPQCRGTQFAFVGRGTANIEEELRKIFPEKSVLRIDSDTRKTVKEEDMKQADILVGTQALQNVSFAGVTQLFFLDADFSMHFPHYAAEEKTLQLIIRLMGRGEEGMQTIIETNRKEHPLFQAIASGELLPFLEQQLQMRKQFGLPPITRGLEIHFLDSDPRKALAKAKRAKILLQQTATDTVIQIFLAFGIEEKNKKKVVLTLFADDPVSIFRRTPLLEWNRVEVLL